MKEKQSISSAKVGMNTGSAIGQIKNTEYTFALNANTNSETEGFNIQNESSNTSGVVFPEGYRTIGFKNDLLKDTTYYILTNPITKKSKIGYVNNTIEDIINQDQESQCTDCSEYNELGVPLELQTQTPSLQFNEYFNDECLAEGEGLNLDINFPIKSIEIKEEKLGTTLYWNDNKNPKRYLNITNIEENPNSHYLLTQEVPCGDDIIVDCPLIDKLLVFPKHNKIDIQADILQVGGNLKMGTYEFYAAYCDLLGNEMTQYSVPVNPISIFDENRNIITQTTLDEFTNFAIKLKVNNLDSNRFKYYKVVCVERNNVDNAQTAFVEGIHPTTDDTIVYTHSGSSSDDFITRGNVSIKRRIDFNKINLIKSYYDKAESTMVSGGRLWSKGLTKREEINLQPVVNLFGAIALDWQTTIAKEDLYKSAIATSKYKGYQRDEVQPFGLRFNFKDGDYSPVFPIVGRPATTEENSPLVTTSGLLTIGKKYVIFNINLGDSFANIGFLTEGAVFTAIGTTPTKWNAGTEVFEYNTASINVNTPNCSVNDRNKKWQILNTATVTDTCNSLNSSIEVQEEITKTCNIEDVFEIASNSLVLNINTEFTDLTSYINENPTIVVPGITEYIEDTYTNHCNPNFGDNCPGEPILTSSYNKIQEVLNEQVVKNEKLETEYLRKSVPQYCSIYKRNTTTGQYAEDIDFENSFMPCDGTIREKVFFRDSNFENEDCNYATQILDSPATGIGYFLNYDANLVKANLVTSIPVSTVATNFESTLHKKAQFFSAAKNGRNKLVLEISKTTPCVSDKDNLPNLGLIRYTIFDSCSTLTELGGGIVDTSLGLLSIIDTTTFPDEFVVAIDSPIVTQTIDDSCTSPILTKTVYLISPPCGCFSILTRNIEYKDITVSWDTIILKKVETYTSECTFNVPTVDECNPKAFVKGKFAYWESTEQYPDNNELYNSSPLIIRSSDLSELSPSKKIDFEEYFTDDIISGVYSLKESTNLTCSNIRHPKMPDNTVAPFMSENSDTLVFAETVIFPLGVTIDSQVIRTMLSVALNNNLITKKEYDNIEGFELLRGDNSIHKSIVASGLGFDMYNYEKENNKWWYPNFPFNDLGKDKFHTTASFGDTLIDHPYSSQANHLFSFLSPDTALTKPTLPTEMSLQGFQFGSAIQTVAQVNEHPKYTILGERARTLSTILAIAEVALETVIKTSELITQGGVGHLWVVGGATNGTNAAGAGVSTGALISYAVTAGIQGFVKVGQYRYQWLKTFRDLGSAYNFAHMTVGIGEYNRFLKNDIESNSYLRGLTIKEYLRDGIFNTVDKSDGVKININNRLREDSVLLSTGEGFRLDYPNEYINYDNNNVNSNSSKVVSSDLNDSVNSEHIRNISSPYITLKNYIPDQWGTVDSIKWLTTNYNFKVLENTNCSPIFGGTICISPYSVRRKTPIFRTTGIDLPDRLPFNYSEYSNIAYPRYVVDYEVDTEYNGLIMPFPDIDSNYKLDCETGANRFYVKPPSKFYLYSYGIVNFLVESEINCHFRYGRAEQKDRFYKKGMNSVDWVQEKNLPISEPNTFFYNNAYSFPVSNTPYKFLDYTYNKDIWRKRNIQPNAVIYSEQENNENDLVDPWLVYKPLNWYEYKTKHGKLINIKDIESQQFLAMFENGIILNNAIDTLVERMTSDNKEVGMAGVFAQRPLEFKSTDLGFAGTQHSEVCSTPFGHIYADCKRGKIFQIDQNGKNLEIISELAGDKPTNMAQWFRENLPFKVLKYLPSIDIDNKYKGIGLNMWWDDRKSRVFITKRDYILQPNIDKNDFYFDADNKKLYHKREEVFFDNTTLFKDVSWTIAYKPQEGSWVSYYSFYPDYSPSHNNFFQVGYNWGIDKGTLWNHLLNNSSFQVFQGRISPFVVEYPIQNENVLKQFNVVSLSVEARRYQNNWDFSSWKDKGFNKFSLYNNTQHSGELNIFPQKSLADNKFYPKTNTDNTQDILFTAVDNKQNINYFFNRTIDQQRNIPIWLRDENSIFKEVNPRAVSFKGKRTLERLKGTEAIIRLENSNESRFNVILKSSINTEIVLD